MADPVLACQSPAARAWPVQYLEFQREITSSGDPAAHLPNPVSLQCEPVNVQVRASVLGQFVQQWSLEAVLVGDFVSVLSLAPSEVLTIEIMRTQHTLLEQSQENASAVEVGTENLFSDKESINIANTSARSANWSVSGSGGFSMYGIGISASATTSQAINTTTASTINSIHETTLKSSQKVTTQTKVQIRGVTETTVEARQTRILRNPFPDRALDLSLYEIVKKFSVQTSQHAVSLMITATLEAINFTEAFISSNQAFLQDALLDADLQSVLPTLVGALRQARPATEQAAADAALSTLEQYLFEDRPGVQPYHNADTNNDTPINAFTNANVHPPPTWTDQSTSAAGVAAGLSSSAGMEIYLNLQMYWMMMGGFAGTPSGLPQWPAFPADRLQLMQGLAAAVRDAWQNRLADGDRMNLMNQTNRTEIFRRIPGFLKLYDDLLGNLVIPQPDMTTVALTNAVVNHLNCNADYYTAQYLRYLWNRLGSVFVIRLVNDTLSSVFPPSGGTYMPDNSRPYLNLYEVENVQRHGLSVMIPLRFDQLPSSASSPLPNFASGLTQLNAAITGSTAAAPAAAEVIVPAEGLHLEPVAGACVLQNVPPAPPAVGH